MRLSASSFTCKLGLPLLLSLSFPLRTGTGQVPKLVKDLSPGFIGVSSTPHNFVRLGRIAIFVATTPDTGTEIWRSDGTATGTFPLEVVSGPLSSFPSDLVVAGKKVFFKANTPSTGNELFVTDGTIKGTKIVKDIVPGRGHSSPQRLVPSANRVFFIARNGTRTFVFVSDGTAAGTRALVPGFYYQAIGFGGKLIFSMSTTTNGIEPWISDGTVTGTKMLKDIIPGVGSGMPTKPTYSMNMAASATQVFFMARDLNHGFELWKTDGTPSGTKMVKDLVPGRGNALSAPYLTVLGNKVLFSAASKLYVSDGTGPGTTALLQTGFYHPEAIQGKVYFFRNNGGKYEVAQTDGTAAGTKTIAILPPKTSALPFFKENPFPLHQALIQGSGNSIYFEARFQPSQFVLDHQLFRVGASPQKPVFLLKGLAPSNNFNLTKAFIGLPGIVLASSDGGKKGTGSHGIELWKTSGSQQTTALLKNLGPDRGLSSLLRELTDQHKGILFQGSAPDPSNPFFHRGNELYHSDGSSQGTGLLRDIATGRSSSIPQNFSWIENKTFFSAKRLHGFELFVSDGTSSGTFEVKDITPGPGSSNPSKAVDYKGTAYFAAGGFFDPNGRELWKSDGTSGGTSLVKDLFPGRGSANPDFLTVFGGRLYFVANDKIHGTELFSTDGTAAGTILVKDIEPGSGGSYPRNLTVVGKTLFFSAATRTAGRELWKTDGTSAGTQMVKDLGAGGLSGVSTSLFDRMVAFGGEVFFVGRLGRQLYKSDGTSAGTTGLLPTFGVRYPRNLVASRKGIFFTLTDSHGIEPWFTKGTPSTTILLKDINPGSKSSIVNQVNQPVFVLSDSGRRIWFQANDGIHGNELWETDGTPAGTKMVADINKGGASSLPQGFVLSGGQVYMVADNGLSGQELFRAFGGATAKSFGHSCSQETFGPTLHSDDPILGSGVHLFGENAGGHVAVFLLAPLPIRILGIQKGCSLYLGSGFLLLDSFGIPPNGAWARNLPIPNNPSLLGNSALFQAAFIKVGAAPHVDLSQGIEWTLGR